jgi:hypothetical protein
MARSYVPDASDIVWISLPPCVISAMEMPIPQTFRLWSVARRCASPRSGRSTELCDFGCRSGLLIAAAIFRWRFGAFTTARSRHH